MDDITDTVKELFESAPVSDALKSEQAEGISDTLLDGVAGAVNSVTGGKFEKQVDAARDAVDGSIGNQ